MLVAGGSHSKRPTDFRILDSTGDFITPVEKRKGEMHGTREEANWKRKVFN